MSTTCPECGAQPGQLHRQGCGVENCPYCGLQLFSCCCDAQARFGVPDDDRMPWTGTWPGEAECQEFGWYAKRDPDGPSWVPCPPDDPEASPDLNRLLENAEWDRANQRWVRK
jgi:hypothetical protein